MTHCNYPFILPSSFRSRLQVVNCPYRIRWGRQQQERYNRKSYTKHSPCPALSLIPVLVLVHTTPFCTAASSALLLWSLGGFVHSPIGLISPSLFSASVQHAANSLFYISHLLYRTAWQLFLLCKCGTSTG